MLLMSPRPTVKLWTEVGSTRYRRVYTTEELTKVWDDVGYTATGPRPSRGRPGNSERWVTRKRSPVSSVGTRRPETGSVPNALPERTSPSTITNLDLT